MLSVSEQITREKNSSVIIVGVPKSIEVTFSLQYGKFIHATWC